ncbi:O-antigen ligase family protein [Curtobacterium sp. PhB115]|uniref:O-antigen ligase family protein n=1 Tax=Curtobacterium sp. PhB115 TaxID=2485173 RepID=UPI000F4BCE12|nr:O-antigen ligase family protein [Curtobacterium sp. PhB115]ROP64318.1 O-antigen ligase-like membrane protein [Curtobacterium sp. PhB115]
MTGLEQGRSQHLLRASLSIAVASTVVLLPGAFDRWFLPKAVVVAVAVIVACTGAPNGRLPRWALTVVVVGGAVLVTTALTSAAPAASFWGRWPRYEGAVMIPVYFASLWLGARLLGPGADARVHRRLSDAVAAVSVLLGVVALLEACGLRPLGGSAARPGALLGNASDQGLVAAVCVVVLVLPLLDRTAGRRTRMFRGTGLVLGVAALVLSGSRGALLAALVGLVVLVVLACGREAQGPRRRVFSVVAAVVGISGLASALLPSTMARITGADRMAAASASDRLLIWHDAVATVLARPWLGLGPSGFEDAVAMHHDSTWQRAVGSQTTLDSPHAWPLQAASAGGIVLLVLAVGTLVAVMVTGSVNRRRAARPDRHELLVVAPAVLSVAVVGLCVTFTTPGVVVLPALFAGAMIAVPPSTTRPASARLRFVFVCAWTAFLLVTTAAEVPLGAAVRHAEQGDLRAAESGFTIAARMRPWDGDIALIAAQSMAAVADARPGETDAADLTVAWSERALHAAPDSLLGAKALAVGQQAEGDLQGAGRTLVRLADAYPFDAQVAHRYGGVLALQGALEPARAQLVRASTLAPDDADVWATLAYVEGQLGDPDAARTAKERSDRLAR